MPYEIPVHLSEPAYANIGAGRAPSTMVALWSRQVERRMEYEVGLSQGVRPIGRETSYVRLLDGPRDLL